MLATLCVLLTTALATPLSAPAPPPVGQAWTADLRAGHAANVAYRDGELTLTAPAGLLTLPPTHLHTKVTRVAPTLDAQSPPDTVVEIDVRARRDNGLWTEWLPATPAAPATLPAPSREIQVRVLLAGDLHGRTARPSVRGLRLTGQLTALRTVAPPGEPAAYQVVATREGLVDGRTANGHTIRPHDLFVALPSHRALTDTDGSEYTVKVCTRAGYCAWAPVWDIGPWNTTDDYWSPQRERFADLPLGTPEAQAAYRDGAYHGRDGSGRRVTNPAGIDLSDGVYEDVLGLSGNALVTVSYLWTGNVPLSPVDAASATGDPLTSPRPGDPEDPLHTSEPPPGGGQGDPAALTSLRTDHRASAGADPGRVTVRTAPDPTSLPAGMAADRAGVPARCVTTNGWLSIDPDAYLPVSAVHLVAPVSPC